MELKLKSCDAGDLEEWCGLVEMTGLLTGCPYHFSDCLSSHDM